MKRPKIDLQTEVPLFDLWSIARGGPGRRDRLSPAEIQQVARTVTRTPEVMVKVLSRAGRTVPDVKRHLDYLDRGGEVALHTDTGESLTGKHASRELLEDWDLDLDAARSRAGLGAGMHRPGRLIHKLLFSMPAGTPPDKVLKAVQKLVREEFALRHRYAMALHTDEPHPHVHVVVKALGEDGQRLNIYKPTLRRWRRMFAENLRELGVPANATERSIRGRTRGAKRDPIYRANLRGESRYFRDHEASAMRVSASAMEIDAQAKQGLLRTRREILRAWDMVRAALDASGHRELAEATKRFASNLPPVRTEREWVTEDIAERSRAHTPSPPSR